MVRNVPHISRVTEDITSDLSPFKGCPGSRTVIGFHYPQDKIYMLIPELRVDFFQYSLLSATEVPVSKSPR